MTDFIPAIRRALQLPCAYDFLACHRLSSVRPWLTSRPAVVRLNSVAELLQSGQGVNARSIARDLGTSDKTIYRDIDCLRKHFGAEITYNPATFTFTMTRPPSIRLTP